MDSREIYNIYHHNSGSDDLSALEAILDKLHNDDRFTLVNMTDSILPSGAYIAVVHFTEVQEDPEKTEERISANAEL